MSSTGLLTTTAGQAAIIADLAGGANLVLSHVAFGDANGVPYNPIESQTALVRERYRATIAGMGVTNGGLFVDAIIPADTNDAQGRPSHGFQIAECGLFAQDGTLIGVARMGNGYKPSPASGQSSIATFRLVITCANPSAISVQIDPQAQIALGRMVRPGWLTVDGITADPPANPASGSTYIIGAAASGAWAGHDSKVAQWIGMWSISIVPEGHVVADNSKPMTDAARFLRRAGNAWISAQAGINSFGFVRRATPADILARQGQGYIAPDDLGSVSVDWDKVGQKPETFPPAAHTHPYVALSPAGGATQTVGGSVVSRQAANQGAASIEPGNNAVSGLVRLEAPGGTSLGAIGGSGNALRIASAGVAPVIIETANGEALRVTDQKMIGIGTLYPSDLVHMKGGSLRVGENPVGWIKVMPGLSSGLTGGFEAYMASGAYKWGINAHNTAMIVDLASAVEFGVRTNGAMAFGVGPNREIRLSDSVGTAGQVLTTQGWGQPAQWQSLGQLIPRLQYDAMFAEGALYGTDVFAGADPATSMWRRVNLNTLSVNSIAGAGAASGQVTLPAGTYRLRGFGIAIDAQYRIRNITAGATVFRTTRIAVNSAAYGLCQAWIDGQFTLAAGAVLELQAFTNQNASYASVAGSGEGHHIASFLVEKVG